MTVNQKIEKALKGLVDDKIWALSKPTEEDPDKWIVFNPSSERPVDFGDDNDLEWNHNMQVHYFEKGHINYFRVRTEMRNILRSVGFSVWATDEDYEEDTNITHVIIECEILEDDIYG